MRIQNGMGFDDDDDVNLWTTHRCLSLLLLDSTQTRAREREVGGGESSPLYRIWWGWRPGGEGGGGLELVHAGKRLGMCCYW